MRNSHFDANLKLSQVRSGRAYCGAFFLHKPPAPRGDQSRSFRRAKTAGPPLRQISKAAFPSPRLLALDLESRHRPRLIPLATRSVTFLRNMPAKQPPRQMTLRQERPIVGGVFNQTVPGVHEPLLQAGSDQLATRAGSAAVMN